MTAFIILTAAEADHVRGPSATDPMSALMPIERQGGTFILPLAVLSAPAHEAHHAYLNGLPRMALDNPAFPPPLNIED